MAHLRSPRGTAVVALLAAALPFTTAGDAAAAKTAPEFSEQVLFAQHTDGYFCFRIPADGGRTWGPLQVVLPGNGDTRTTNDVSPGELSATELAGGRIYVNARDNTGTDPGNRNTATSRDGGQTFDAPFRTLPKLDAPKVQGSVLSVGHRIFLSVPDHPVSREIMAVRSSDDDGRNFQQVDKVIYWGPSAYSDLVDLGGDHLGLLYEAGQTGPYEAIRFAQFNDAYLRTPDGTPPGLPKPPQPGPTTPDLSGYRNDGYVRGGMSSPSEFDGVDDYVQVPWARSLDLGAGDFTSTARIHYTDITGTRAILWAYRVGSGAPQIWLRAEPANKRLIATLGTGEGTATVTTPQAYNDGQWHDVVLRRAGGRLTLTVDGRTTSVTAPGGSVTEGKQFTIDGIDIGQRLDGLQRFHGSISDVRIYSRAVPDDELATARHGLRLWLPLDRIGGKG